MSKKNISLLVMLLISTIVIAVGGYMRWQLKQGSTTPPAAGEAVYLINMAQAATLPDGFVVWSSNRNGNHDILLMQLPERRIKRLTSHPHTEYFPRISPDGKKIVFARSHKPRVSQRKQEPWDVILLELDSGKERLLAKNGNAPTWSADGKRVYFQRDATHFVEHHVATGKERVLFSSGQGNIQKKTVLGTPQYNEKSKRFAVTLRNAQHATGTLDLEGDFNRISDGCQMTWNKQGEFLYFIDYGGRMKNAVYRHDPKKGKTEMWLDLPGEFSHEYFPKLSNDENYMVLGSSAGGHEHDRADYEIFLWQPGTSPDSAERLTFHTGNDNWPDVYINSK